MCESFTFINLGLRGVFGIRVFGIFFAVRSKCTIWGIIVATCLSALKLN